MSHIKKQRHFSITEGPILSSMIRYAIPIICSSLLSLLYQSMDLFVLSFFSATDAVASVGSTTSIVSLFLSICSGLGAGIGIAIVLIFLGESHLKRRIVIGKRGVLAKDITETQSVLMGEAIGRAKINAQTR